MSTFDFSKFESTNQSSTFQEQFTVEEVKEACGGADFRVIPSKGKNTFFFACGRVRGYVARELGNKLQKKQPVETMIISHVVADDFDGLMLHEQSTGTAIAVW